MQCNSLDKNLESDAISRTKAARRSRNAVWGLKNKVENGVQAFSLSARQGLAGGHGQVSGFVKKSPVQPNSDLGLWPAGKEEGGGDGGRGERERGRGGGGGDGGGGGGGCG